MDYEKKYNKALQKIRELIKKGKENGWTITTYEKDFEKIFPELRESEDERIRKALIELVKCNERGGYKLLNNVHTSSMLAWLEKQGQVKESPISQHENKTCKENDGSLTDDVEPKFHEGEWVIDKQGIVHQIAKAVEIVTNHTYGYDIVGGGYFNDNIEGIRLWTIEDAKDGDVLVASDGSIFIFKEVVDSGCKHYIALEEEDGTIQVNDNSAYCWESVFGVCPATKEQRDTLFAKMHEAGYEWNSEKKELKKIPNALEEREIVHIEHGKCYYCIKDYYAGGNKRASKGDVVMALNGMSMMDIGVKANEYFIPVNNIELKPAEWSEEDEENMNNALYILNQLKDTSSYEDDIAEKIIVWLKSLKQRIGG